MWEVLLTVSCDSLKRWQWRHVQRSSLYMTLWRHREDNKGNKGDRGGTCVRRMCVVAQGGTACTQVQLHNNAALVPQLT